MFFDRVSADFRARAHITAVVVIAGIALSMLTSCNGDASGSGCVVFAPGVVIDFSDDVTGGFDDFRSAGAALGVAIDQGNPEMGLVIALSMMMGRTAKSLPVVPLKLFHQASSGRSL